MNPTPDNEKILHVTEVAIQQNGHPAICVKVDMPLKRSEFETIQEILREQYPAATHLFLTYHELEITPGENPHARKQDEKPV